MRARQLVREWMAADGFGIVDQTKMVTAVSELARNTIEYGLGGTLDLEMLEEGLRHGVSAEFRDSGPGIADLEAALADGHSTGAGLGLGLGGARRLVNDFEIESLPGRGTRIRITRWR